MVKKCPWITACVKLSNDDDDDINKRYSQRSAQTPLLGDVLTLVSALDTDPLLPVSCFTGCDPSVLAIPRATSL